MYVEKCGTRAPFLALLACYGLPLYPLPLVIPPKNHTYLYVIDHSFIHKQRCTHTDTLTTTTDRCPSREQIRYFE